MSDTQAIAAVTAGLAAMLADIVSESAGAGVPGAQVTHQQPDAPELDSGNPIVNLFLYRIERNPSASIADLPTRQSDGARLQAPTAAVNLVYMISAFGDQATLTPQRLMGAVVAGLHATPRLSQAYLQVGLSNYGWLRPESLPDDNDIIITDRPDAGDELSRLWRDFPRSSYHLSTLYEASVVLLRDGRVPGRALPVRKVRIAPSPMGPLRLRSVQPLAPDQPLVAGSVLVLHGEGLPGPGAEVLVGGAPAGSLRLSGADRIELELSPDNVPGLAAGLLTLQVIGPPDATGGRARSPVEHALLRPRIDGAPSCSAGVAHVQIVPPLSPGQKATLRLNALDGQSAPLAFEVLAAQSDPSRLAFAVSGAPAGRYLAQVVIGELSSPLLVDSQGAYVFPLLDIPPETPGSAP